MWTKHLKTAVAVCEYNPFHNGHKLHIDSMRDCDVKAVVMSGDFCQRGEMTVLDKYTRARHAVLSGADIVFELPAVFAVAPAEIFAKGAIKLLDSLKGDKVLYFGAEKGEKEDFLAVAKAMRTESKEFKAALKEHLKKGEPYALARYEALKETDKSCDFSILDTPNSVLGVEYVKALLDLGSNTEIRPIKREGGYSDLSLNGDFCSAAAIRNAIEDGKRKKIKKFVPEHVFIDLPDKIPDCDKLMLFRILEASNRELKSVVDCTEGLENRFKAFARSSTELKVFLDKIETKRYTRARLRRIITANLLGITSDFTEKCLKSNLYLKVLAVAADKMDLLSAYSGGKTRLLTRKTDVDALSGTALHCYQKDLYAQSVYELASGSINNDSRLQIIKR